MLYPSKTKMVMTFINHKMAIFLLKINLKDVILEKFSCHQLTVLEVLVLLFVQARRRRCLKTNRDILTNQKMRREIQIPQDFHQHVSFSPERCTLVEFSIVEFVVYGNL
jgi:hypothetical protein